MEDKTFDFNRYCAVGAILATTDNPIKRKIAIHKLAKSANYEYKFIIFPIGLGKYLDDYSHGEIVKFFKSSII
jgi:hypothetical protein